MRGELNLDSSWQGHRFGSSPHAWGTENILVEGQGWRRFIPTCVGNWPELSCHCSLLTVHPHMRGELPEPVFDAFDFRGSSPHAWGTVRGNTPSAGGRRFIPTCVGNWAVATGSKEACSVHPHMRGELATVTTDAGYDPGSSPHAWGTGISRKHAKIIRRFIPTCVGNWERSFSVHVAVPVHPHMRGELFADAPRVSQSAPRVSRRAWFIPTCVGNCRHRRKSNSESPVHPHMRGEL